MKKITILFAAVSLLTHIISCGTVNQKLNHRMKKVKGSKIVVEEDRALDDFSVVNIDYYAVTLVHGTVNKVRIVGEDNVLPELHFLNKGGVLSVSLTENMYLHVNHPIKIYVHFTDLKEVRSDAGNYTSDGAIRGNHLKVRSRRGSFNLLVDVDTLSAELSGSGRCRAALYASGTVGSAHIALEKNAIFDSPELSGKEFKIAYSQDAYFRIKMKNFEKTNVLFPTNKVVGPVASGHIKGIFGRRSLDKVPFSYLN